MTQDFFRQSCTFTAGAQEPSQLPPAILPEVAFVGRSNVGKSSLINALTYRKSLARISSTPGRTTQINFFCLANAFNLVDLPGYGYAEKSKKMLVQWQTLINFYLTERLTLKRVYVLIDSRRGIGPKDLIMMEFLNRFALSYQVVLTKADQLKPQERQDVQEKTRQALQYQVAAYPNVLAVSIHDQKSVDTLRQAIINLIHQ